MVCLKYNAVYKLKQKIQLLLPRNKISRHQISYLTSVVARFNSNNIKFTFNRNRIELWWKSRHGDALLFCATLNYNNCESLDDMILKLAEWCRVMKNAIHENARWFLMFVSFNSCKVEDNDMKFLDIMSRFNGNSQEQLEMFLDLMGITHA